MKRGRVLPPLRQRTLSPNPGTISPLRAAARSVGTVSSAPMSVRDLWVQVDWQLPDVEQLPAFELRLEELPSTIGHVQANGDPGPSMTWQIKIGGNEALDEHLGIEDTGDPVNAAKACVEEIMLSMLSGHQKAALARRLHTASAAIRRSSRSSKRARPEGEARQRLPQGR